MASLSDLFDDIIKFEIFSRTSLPTFNTMRCANKEFDSLSYNPFLQSLRKERTNEFAGFLMQEIDSTLRRINHWYAPASGTPSLPVTFLPAESRVLCSSENGLVVFEQICPNTQEVFRYHVAKPATNQIIAIPNTIIGFRTLNMAIVTLSTSPFRYNILRLSAAGTIKTHGCDLLSPVRLELFDSRSWEWREFNWLFMDYGVHPLTEQPIVVSGTVHVLFSNMTIVPFNMFSETVSSILPPLTVGLIPGLYPIKAEIFKYNRSLGFARRATNNIWTFWVLQEGVRWVDMHNVLIPPPLTAALRMSYNDYRFFTENNVVDNVTELHYKLFLFKSDNEPVILNGRD